MKGIMTIAIPYIIREINYDIAEEKQQQWVMCDGIHLSNEDAIAELRSLMDQGIDTLPIGD